MTTLNIDGVGRVEVGAGFLRLSPEQQAAEVDAIVAQFKGASQPATEVSAVPEVPGPTATPRVATASAAPAAPTSKAGAAGAVTRVIERAGEVAKDRFGDREFGLSKETIGELVDKGVIAGEGQTPTPIQLLNQIVYQYGSKAGDLALRSIAGIIGGVQGAVGQTAQELGADQGMARRLERDVGMGVESAGVVSGTGPATPRTPRTAAPAAGEAAAAGETLGPQAVKIASPAGAAEFKAASQSFYKAADDAGVVIKPQSYAGLSDDIFKTAAKERLDPTLTPGSMAAVKRIQELADPKVGPISFQTLDTMRQIAGDARKSAKAGSNDARVAGVIIDKIDDYVAKLGSADVVAGNAKVAADTIVKARDLWSRAAKLDTIENMVDRAATSAGQFSGSGFENGLRTEFRALAKSKERMKTFSADEQKAIKLVARGSTGGNVARAAGRFAARGPVSALAGAGVGGTIGSAVLGPGIGTVVGAGVQFGIGEVGRVVATALTKRSIRQLEDIIRQGGESAMARASLTRANNLLAGMEETSIAGAAAPNQRRQ